MVLALLPKFVGSLLVSRRVIMETTGAWNKYSEEQVYLRIEAPAPADA